MPRTPIPRHLVHQPEEVERNAQRFDQLCRLAEEVALPVVKHALIREATTTGAEALVEEATVALGGLVEEAVLAGIETPAVIEQLRRSLEDRVPDPDEEEWRALTRDAAQILMSVWLETLRAGLSKKPLLQLCEYLLPATPVSWMQRLCSLVAEKQNLPRSVAEPLASLPMTEEETAEIMSTFRAKLFAVPRRVDLPFDLVIAGAPEMPVLAMDHSMYEQLQHVVLAHAAGHTAQPVRRVPMGEPVDFAGFVTPDARSAVASLTAKMTNDDYNSLLQKATNV